MPAPEQAKNYFPKEFLDQVDEAMALAAKNGAAMILTYKRPGKLPIRVKIECTPPVVATSIVVMEGT